MCDAAALAAAVSSPQSSSTPTHFPVFPFDHVHPSSSLGDGVHTVVVYATLGTAQAAAFHRAAMAAVADAAVRVRYVLRHVVPSGADSTVLPLQGFGVGLDIKNMEYKALDDRAPGVWVHHVPVARACVG